MRLRSLTALAALVASCFAASPAALAQQKFITVVTAIGAMLVFAAGTQGWFVRRNRWWESALLLLVTFMLLRPGFWIDLGWEKYRVEAASRITQLATAAPDESSLRLRIEGTSLEGKDVKKTVLLPLGKEGDGAQRMKRAGLTLAVLGDRVDVLAVGLKSPAAKAGIEQGFHVKGIEVEADRPAKQWIYIPAALLVLLVFFLQRMRREDVPPLGASATA